MILRRSSFHQKKFQLCSSFGSECNFFWDRRYKRDPNKSGGGTQCFSITPYSLNGSRSFLIFCGDFSLGKVRVIVPLFIHQADTSGATMAIFSCVLRDSTTYFVDLSVGPSVHPLVPLSAGPSHFTFFWFFCSLWPHRSCPNDLLTSKTAPAHPQATRVAVYPALLNFHLEHPQITTKSPFELL